MAVRKASVAGAKTSAPCLDFRDFGQDQAANKRDFEVIMTMTKIETAEIEAALAGYRVSILAARFQMRRAADRLNDGYLCAQLVSTISVPTLMGLPPAVFCLSRMTRK